MSETNVEVHMKHLKRTGEIRLMNKFHLCLQLKEKIGFGVILGKYLYNI